MLENYLIRNIKLSTINDIVNFTKMRLACHYKMYMHTLYDKTDYYKRRKFYRLIIIGPVKIHVNYNIRFISIEYSNYTYAIHIELDQFANDFITMEDLFKRLDLFINAVEEISK